MSDNSDPSDPFAAFNSDRTIIKPSAGRTPRSTAGAGNGAPQGMAPAMPASPQSAAASGGNGKDAPLS
ncbi:hypothetical protein ACVBEH_28560, partial [Roseateles sp. GG27B]